jgi:phosphoribosylformylglycinamidine cyclo-ligase
MKKEMTYADSGVDIELGDDVSKILYNAAKETWINRKGKLGEVIVPFDDFSGIRAINVSNLPAGTLMGMGFDGIGTKVKVAQMVGDHSTIAYDLIAMVAEDALVRGAEPVVVGTIFDVNSLKHEDKPFLDEVRQLAEGYINAAKAANVAVLTGETAELGDCVGGFGPFNYNWGAGLVWFAKKDRMFTGMEIKEGDSLVGLKEEGFRSNGLSLPRKILGNEFGVEWYKILWNHGESTLGRMVLNPSKIYTPAVVDMFGGYNREPRTEVHGVAHITGGGLPGKLGRVLKPSGLGAIIDKPFEPSEFMEYVQKLGNVSDNEAYKTWNMRHGMVIITPKPEEVISIAKEYNIESKNIGEVVKEPRIRIRNRGAFSTRKNKELIF